MLGGIRQRLTFANVMSTIAVFCALGGGAYAAVALPKNSVGSKQLKKNAITNAKIGKNAVTGAKVKNGSLTGADIKLSTLPKVGSATNADNAAHAANADNATNATNATNAVNATKATNADHATNADNIAAPENWHEVGTAGEPTFYPGASNRPDMAPVELEHASFYKDKEGVVHLKGFVIIGTGGFIFSLPQGYRPAAKKLTAFAVVCNTCTSTDSNSDTSAVGTTPLVVLGSGIDPSLPDGLVAATLADPGDEVLLDGVTFRAEG
jgi:hypothetical protein